MTARKAAHSLQRAKGALASGFATVDLHHATGHDRASAHLAIPKCVLTANSRQRCSAVAAEGTACLGKAHETQWESIGREDRIA
jgi:hypothetical protein